MVRTYLKTVLMGKVDVLFIFIVYTVAALGCLQINVGHLGFSNRLPEHIALVMAQINTVNVTACIFAFDSVRLGKAAGENKYTEYQ